MHKFFVYFRQRTATYCIIRFIWFFSSLCKLFIVFWNFLKVFLNNRHWRRDPTQFSERVGTFSLRPTYTILILEQSFWHIWYQVAHSFKSRAVENFRHPFHSRRVVLFIFLLLLLLSLSTLETRLNRFHLWKQSNSLNFILFDQHCYQASNEP